MREAGGLEGLAPVADEVLVDLQGRGLWLRLGEEGQQAGYPLGGNVVGQLWWLFSAHASPSRVR